MTKEEILNLDGTFLWGFNKEFFIVTDFVSFIWSDSDCGGDNTLKLTTLSYEKWLKKQNIPCARDKGNHLIKDYCGKEVKII